MDGNLAMANSLENKTEPADIFEHKYGFNKEQSIALEAIYIENNTAGKTISMQDLSSIVRRLFASDESSGLHKHIVNGTCVDCHYSDNGAHGCNRLMKGVKPKIDKSKGVECAHNGYVHYLPYTHCR